MSQCQIHGYYGTSFCSECVSGPNSAQEAGYRLFNEDRALGQNQYASRYTEGGQDYPNLGRGLRFLGDVSDYHTIYIHVDDYDEFHQRVSNHKKGL